MCTIGPDYDIYSVDFVREQHPGVATIKTNTMKNATACAVVT